MSELILSSLCLCRSLLFNSKDRFDYDFFFAVRDLINNRDYSLSCFTQVLKSILSYKIEINKTYYNVIILLCLL